MSMEFVIENDENVLESDSDDGRITKYIQNHEIIHFKSKSYAMWIASQ